MVRLGEVELVIAPGGNIGVNLRQGGGKCRGCLSGLPVQGGGPGGGLCAGRLRHRGGKLGKPGQRGGGGLGGHIGRQGGGSLVGNGPQAPGTGPGGGLHLGQYAQQLVGGMGHPYLGGWAKLGLQAGTAGV